MKRIAMIVIAFLAVACLLIYVGTHWGLKEREKNVDNQPKDSVPGNGTSIVPTKPSKSTTNWRIRDVDLQLPTGWHPDSSRSDAWLGLVRIPTSDDSPQDFILTVHSFESGFPDPKSTVDQWCIDFLQPDGNAGQRFLEREELTMPAPKKAALIDVVGTYHPRAIPGTAPSEPKTNWRLCVAVLQVPSGHLYFRMIGPKDAVKVEREKLKYMIQTAQ
jgi:hypothetical protein